MPPTASSRCGSRSTGWTRSRSTTSAAAQGSATAGRRSSTSRTSRSCRTTGCAPTASRRPPTSGPWRRPPPCSPSGSALAARPPFLPPPAGRGSPGGRRADSVAAAAHIRAVASPASLFTIGFCMGGRLAFLTAGFGLGLAGVIGLYGWPTGPSRNGTPAPAEVVKTFECPVLAIFGGADEGIPPASVGAFEQALAAAGADHRVITYHRPPPTFFHPN